MVYLTSWDEFVERSVQLFRSDPYSTRYVMKYRHCDGKLVLKVSDNREDFIHHIRGIVQFVLRMPDGKLSIFLFWMNKLSTSGDPGMFLASFASKVADKTIYKLRSVIAMEELDMLNFVFRGGKVLIIQAELDLSEVTDKEQMEAQPTKKGRGRKQSLITNRITGVSG